MTTEKDRPTLANNEDSDCSFLDDDNRNSGSDRDLDVKGGGSRDEQSAAAKDKQILGQHFTRLDAESLFKKSVWKSKYSVFN